LTNADCCSEICDSDSVCFSLLPSGVVVSKL